MIGIGVTTYNRPEILEKCLENIRRFTKSDYTLYVAEDKNDDRKGIAKRKNECLYFLQDFEYIFLFDDDCYPIQEGWEQSIIDSSKKTKSQHFCYNKEPFYKIEGYQYINDVELECYGASGGVLLFYTKDVIKAIGGFYEGYDTYGFEHIGHSIRIFRSGLSADLFCCPSDLKKYIYSHDYDENDFFKNNSTIDIHTKNLLTAKNKKICFEQDLKIYIPLQ